jgi:hypothetical protein
MNRSSRDPTEDNFAAEVGSGRHQDLSSPTGPGRSFRVSQFNLHRLIVVSLALVSLILAGVWMTVISRTDPWYRNTDMNAHNMVDALSINSNVSPHGIDQPGLPLKYLLALDYRVRHYAGLLPVWNLKKFGASEDPLQEIPALIRVGRVHSRVLVFLVILSAAWLTGSVARNLESPCLTVILLCGSAGLLFHGLLTRPELLCVGFGNVLALACVWRATATPHQTRKYFWLFLSGLFVGLAALTKLPGMCYLAVCYGWCWLAALTPGTGVPPSVPRSGQTDFWWGLLPAASGASVLLLLLQVAKYHAELDPVVILRLRIAAVLVAVLPLLTLWTRRHRLWSFLLERSRELALLGAGALVALSISYLSLRTVMTESSAADYLAGVLHVLVNPRPLMHDLLASKPDVSREFLQFFKETPALFISATVAALAVCSLRSVPLRIKAFILLLLATGLGMALLMSERYFTAQYSIFPQVPLLLVWSLSLSAFLGAWRREPLRSEDTHWALPVSFTAIFVLMLTGYFRLQPKYTMYQSDAGLPVNGLTLTFLFDHDVHTEAYLKIMKDHYRDRENFAKVLDQYLADPANRY